MASSRTTNTAEEELFRLVQTIAGLRTLPDADVDFYTKLLDLVTTKARMPQQQMQQAGMLPPQGANPMGAGALGLPPMGPGGGGPPMGMPVPPSPALGGAPPPGLSLPGPGPTQDELSMLLGAGV